MNYRSLWLTTWYAPHNSQSKPVIASRAIMCCESSNEATKVRVQQGWHLPCTQPSGVQSSLGVIPEYRVGVKPKHCQLYQIYIYTNKKRKNGNLPVRAWRMTQWLKHVFCKFVDIPLLPTAAHMCWLRILQLSCQGTLALQQNMWHPPPAHSQGCVSTVEKYVSPDKHQGHMYECQTIHACKPRHQRNGKGKTRQSPSGILKVRLLKSDPRPNRKLSDSKTIYKPPLRE